MLKRRRRKSLIHLARIIAMFFAGLTVAVIIALSQIDINQMKSKIVGALESSTGLPIEINGMVSWNFSLRPMIQIKDVRIQNAKWANHKYAVVIPRVLIEINPLSIFRDTPTIESVSVINPIVNIEQNDKGEYSVNPKSSKPVQNSDNTYPFDLDFGIGALELYNPQIFLIKPNSIRSLTPERLRVGLVKSVDTIDYSGYISDRDGDYPFLVSFSKLDEKKKIYPVKVTIAGDVMPSVTEMDLDKKTKLPVRFSVSGVANNLPIIGQSFGIKLPEISSAKIYVHGGLSKHRITLDNFSIKTLKSDLALSGFYDFSGSKPNIFVKLKSGTVDLDEVFPNLYGSEKYFWKRPNRPLNAFLDTPLYGNLLSEFNGTFEGTMGELKIYRKMSVQDIYAKVDLKNGLAKIKTDANYVGGNFKTKIVAKHIGNGQLSVQVAATGRNISVGDIFASVNSTDFIADLPANFDFFFVGHGADLSELVKNTTGPMLITSVEGGYAFDELINVLYGQDFLSAIRKSTYDIFTGKKKNQVRINCAIVNLKVRNGRTDIDQNVVVQTRAVNVRLFGNVDFGKEKMELAMDTTPTDGLRLSLSGNIANSMEFKGSLSEPTLQFKREAVVEKLATATGVGLAIGVLTGGVGAIVGAGVGLVGGDVIGNWTADESPCRTALREGAPKSKRGDPIFLNKPVAQTVEEFINSQD